MLEGNEPGLSHIPDQEIKGHGVGRVLSRLTETKPDHPTVQGSPVWCGWKRAFLPLLLLLNSLSYLKEWRQCLIPASIPFVHPLASSLGDQEGNSWGRGDTTELGICVDKKHPKGHPGTQGLIV